MATMCCLFVVQHTMVCLVAANHFKSEGYGGAFFSAGSLSLILSYGSAILLQMWLRLELNLHACNLLGISSVSQGIS